jgi:hypothetical protein
VDERERNVVKRRIKEARFPKVKTLEEFHFETASHIPSSRLRKLAEGEYVGRTEPVIFFVHQNRGPFLLAVLWNPPTSANCCNRDGTTSERFSLSPQFWT